MEQLENLKKRFLVLYKKYRRYDPGGFIVLWTRSLSVIPAQTAKDLIIHKEPLFDATDRSLAYHCNKPELWESFVDLAEEAIFEIEEKYRLAADIHEKRTPLRKWLEYIFYCGICQRKDFAYRHVDDFAGEVPEIRDPLQASIDAIETTLEMMKQDEKPKIDRGQFDDDCKYLKALLKSLDWSDSEKRWLARPVDPKKPIDLQKPEWEELFRATEYVKRLSGLSGEVIVCGWDDNRFLDFAIEAGKLIKSNVFEKYGVPEGMDPEIAWCYLLFEMFPEKTVTHLLDTEILQNPIQKSKEAIEKLLEDATVKIDSPEPPDRNMSRKPKQKLKKNWGYAKDFNKHYGCNLSSWLSRNWVDNDAEEQPTNKVLRKGKRGKYQYNSKNVHELWYLPERAKEKK